MLIEYEQLLYYKGFMEWCQYIFESREWGRLRRGWDRGREWGAF